MGYRGRRRRITAAAAMTLPNSTKAGGAGTVAGVFDPVTVKGEGTLPLRPNGSFTAANADVIAAGPLT